MNIDKLRSLVNNEVSVETFLNEHKEEITGYIKDRSGSKDTVEIMVEDPGSFLYASTNEIIELLHLYLGGELKEWDLEYIFSFLEAHDIDNEVVEEVITSFADPYLNFPINKHNMKAALDYVSNKSQALKVKGNSRSGNNEDYIRKGYKTALNS